MNRKRIKDELASFMDVLSDDQLRRLLNMVKNENWEAMSNRIHSRKKLKPVSDLSNGGPVPFAIRNISLGGAFIETDRTLVMGQTITLEIAFEDSSEMVVIPGKVVRANAFGFGIQFEFKDESTKNVLTKKLSS
ncbi:MAG: PilZ domain-containing protein [Pseudomonadota bacterium]